MTARHLHRTKLFACVVTVCALSAYLFPDIGACTDKKSSGNPLSAWRDGASKQAIVEFVRAVTTKGPDYVAPEDRIAVFDNDGTLWCEMPFYTQLAFAMDRAKDLAKTDPALQTLDMKDIEKLIAVTHTGMTTDEFANIVSQWIATAKHPRFKQSYDHCTYIPMVQLLSYLRDSGFKTFIVSGGGNDFMRPWAPKSYGIPPEQIIGTTGKLKFEVGGNRAVLKKLPEVEFVDDKNGKPINIESRIGKHPIAAFGNSDGDLEMLQYTALAGKPGKRLCMIIHHTDATREYAYDVNSKIGHLDVALKEATQRKWNVVDMKNDWRQVFSWDSAK